jgi:hypothetical protein
VVETLIALGRARGEADGAPAPRTVSDGITGAGCPRMT